MYFVKAFPFLWSSLVDMFVDRFDQFLSNQGLVLASLVITRNITNYMTNQNQLAKTIVVRTRSCAWFEPCDWMPSLSPIVHRVNQRESLSICGYNFLNQTMSLGSNQGWNSSPKRLWLEPDHVPVTYISGWTRLAKNKPQQSGTGQATPVNDQL